MTISCSTNPIAIRRIACGGKAGALVLSGL